MLHACRVRNRAKKLKARLVLHAPDGWAVRRPAGQTELRDGFLRGKMARQDGWANGKAAGRPAGPAEHSTTAFCAFDGSAFELTTGRAQTRTLMHVDDILVDLAGTSQRSAGGCHMARCPSGSAVVQARSQFRSDSHDVQARMNRIRSERAQPSREKIRSLIAT